MLLIYVVKTKPPKQLPYHGEKQKYKLPAKTWKFMNKNLFVFIKVGLNNVNYGN